MTSIVPRRVISAVDPTASNESSTERSAGMQRQGNSARGSLTSEISLAARIGRLVFVIATLLVLGFGARLSSLEQFTPSEGPGYAFGIIGGTMILVLLLYPARKRVKFMNDMGSAPA